MTKYAEIDSDRLWQRHMDMAKIGATEGGGVHRLALTGEDIAAHHLFAEWAEARGFSVALDDIGNMFVRREGIDNSLPPVCSGSHTDTQPFGGRFDGITGVLAAFEALEAIEDAGIETRAPLEAIAWNNEEGSRFVPSCMGSAVYAGNEALDMMLAAEDADGITMGHCVHKLKATLPEAAHRELGAPMAAFIEAHIEQGPELEASGNLIGIVTGMQGYRRFAVEVKGEDAHSGTTPRSRRKDAFMAANDIVQALRSELEDEADTIRFTIGRFNVFPGGITVVPGRVTFNIDVRHSDAATLDHVEKRVPEICRENSGPCDVTIDMYTKQSPIEFSADLAERVTAVTEHRGYPHQPIYSGAGHDARHALKLCPSGMIFLPCWRGISHNEAESAEPEHIAAAAQVICDLLVELANEHGGQ